MVSSALSIRCVYFTIIYKFVFIKCIIYAIACTFTSFTLNKKKKCFFFYFFKLINAALLYTNTINTFFNHIIIIFIITFYEGLIGGLIYVNTFNILHKTVFNNFINKIFYFIFRLKFIESLVWVL